VSPRSRAPGPHAEDDGPDLKPLFNDLVRLETELWNAVEGRLRAEHSVTLPFFEFMQIIARTPGCRVQDIAAELSITVGGTSKIVDRIEAAGYCARQANPSDRRSSIVTLTASGKRLLPKITATVDSELRARLGQKMTERSLTELAKTLTRLRSGTQGVEVVRKTA
jgi:MarR family transcriptional regulator, organic hydroperoxide resistance regulator